MIYLLLIICFVLSAFFSASEMAFVSCNKLRLKRYVSEKKKGAELVERLHHQPRDLLAALLVGNNLANVSVTALTAYLLSHHFNIENEFFVTLCVAPVLIVFAETVPKDYARQKADEFVYQLAPYMVLFTRLFQPFSRFILRLSDVLFKALGSYEKKSPFVTKEEFHYLINESVRQGVIPEHEKRLVDTILNFEKTCVEEVMTPLEHAAQLELGQKVGDLKALARKSGASFVLVYEEIPSIIVGVIYIFDTLFESDDARPLTSFLRSPLFVPRDTSAEKAFLRLQQSHQSFAVVVDEDQEAVGVVGIDNLISL